MEFRPIDRIRYAEGVSHLSDLTDIQIHFLNAITVLRRCAYDKESGTVNVVGEVSISRRNIGERDDSVGSKYWNYIKEHGFPITFGKVTGDIWVQDIPIT